MRKSARFYIILFRNKNNYSEIQPLFLLFYKLNLIFRITWNRKRLCTRIVSSKVWIEIEI